MWGNLFEDVYYNVIVVVWWVCKCLFLEYCWLLCFPTLGVIRSGFGRCVGQAGSILMAAGFIFVEKIIKFRS